MRKGKVSYNTAVLLHMVPDMARYYHLDRWGEKPLLNTAARTADYAASLFMGRRYEAVYMICLNTQLRVNHAALLHEGTDVYKRQGERPAEKGQAHHAPVHVPGQDHLGSPVGVARQVQGRVGQKDRRLGGLCAHHRRQRRPVGVQAGGVGVLVVGPGQQRPGQADARARPLQPDPLPVQPDHALSLIHI